MTDEPEVFEPDGARASSVRRLRVPIAIAATATVAVTGVAGYSLYREFLRPHRYGFQQCTTDSHGNFVNCHTVYSTYRGNPANMPVCTPMRGWELTGRKSA
jgi:hypothetical protein